MLYKFDGDVMFKKRRHKSFLNLFFKINFECAWCSHLWYHLCTILNILISGKKKNISCVFSHNFFAYPLLFKNAVRVFCVCVHLCVLLGQLRCKSVYGDLYALGLHQCKNKSCSRKQIYAIQLQFFIGALLPSAL